MFDFNLSPANTLLWVAGILGAVYFFLFFRLVTREPDQRAILVATKNKIGSYLSVPILVLTVFAPSPYKIVAAIAFIPVLAILAWIQHRAMVKHGASPAFLVRLNWTSALCFIALAAFVGSMVLAG